jgi:hypothetical protein
MSLAATQRFMADALQRVSTLAEDPQAVREAERIAAGNERLSPVEQVDVYREQFWLRHVDVLRDDFAAIERALGEVAFEALARAYLRARPSDSFTLRDLGTGMAEFLAAHAPWSADPFLAEVARVEWAFVEAFDGPDAPPFDPTTIEGRAEDAWPSARIVLHPSLQRLALAYPAHDYRIAARKGEVARPDARVCHAVVYRGPELLHCLEIGADAATMLDELSAGKPLGEACEGAALRSGTDLATFEGKLAGWFAEWTALGWIRAVVFTSPRPSP